MGQLLTTTRFYLHGKEHSTQTGYLAATAAYKVPPQLSPIASADESDGVDMTGKHVIVTGGNSGIGYEVATYLASKNASVNLFCRNEERASAAVTKIKEATNNDDVKYTICDVSTKSSIDAATTSINNLDVLICNAGVLLNDRQETPDGIETTLASHLIFGSHYLSRKLLPSLSNKSGGGGGGGGGYGGFGGY